MQLGIPGTVRITSQSHLTPSDTAIRVYSVVYAATKTNTCLHLCNNNGTEASSTTTALPRIPVHADRSQTGSWNAGAKGVLFEDGVLVFTSTSFSYATITFSTEL